MNKESAIKKHKVLPIHIACMTGNKGALKSLISCIPKRGLESKDYLGRTPLILTVSGNYLECGVVLLKAGATVDNTDNAGQTALHVAACKGFHQFVRELLSYKASWMQRDSFGATALHMAAIHPNVKGLTVIVKYLKPAEIDVQDSSLQTALHWSAAYAYNDNIKVLLAQGANTCIPDVDGKTPLHWAVANSSPEALACVKTLLKNKDSLINWQDYQGRSPLHIAVACGSEEVVYYLASKENCIVDILDNCFCTPLHCAAKKGLSEKADILLKKRATHLSKDDNGATPLHYAVHNDHAETVKVFISKNYINDEPDRFGRSALMWAAIKNAESALELLTSVISSLEYADKNGVTALHAAAIYGNVPAIELLVKAGTSVDIKDKYGMTPFLKACEFGRSKAALALLNLNANMNEIDFNSCSALHWCARRGHAFLTEILIKRGANFDIQDSLGMTPLHYTSATGDFINCTCVLVESGADLNVVDLEGKTPLHSAVLNESFGVVRYLCEHGSDVNAKFLFENDWVTPYDCAMLKYNVDIATLLERYGGVRAQDIKECAAKVIQKWMKGKFLKPVDSSVSEKLSEMSGPCKNQKSLLISSYQESFLSDLLMKKDLFYICNGCFHTCVCQATSKKNVTANEKILSSSLNCKDTKVSEYKLLTLCKNPLICKGLVHFNNAFFHVVIMQENFSTLYLSNSVCDKAARIIQRTWKQYILKKRFSRIRYDVGLSYTNADEQQRDEEILRLKFQQFFKNFFD